MVDIEKLMKEIELSLPHSYPFRMVDRILELDPGKRAIATKMVSYDDFLCGKNFPSRSYVPEVLIIEGLAQTGGIAMLSGEKRKVGFLVKVEEISFFKPLSAGVQLIYLAEVQFRFGTMAKVKVSAKIADEVIAKGTLVLAEGE